MSKLVHMTLLAALALSSPAYAKDKESAVEKAIRDELLEDDASARGQGRPDDPGTQGQDTAAEKQSQGHGQGNRQEDSLEQRVREELSTGENTRKKQEKQK